MTLGNRVALAGGTVVFAALLLASLIIYPSLSAGLHRQHDDVLVTAADQDASKLLKEFTFKLEQMEREGARLTVPTSPVTVGSTQLQFMVPPVEAGPGGGFIPVTERDVQVSRGRAPAYFQDAEYKGVSYRVYTAPLTGMKGAVVRAAIPQSVVRSTLRPLAALLAAITAGGIVLAALGARLVAGRVLRPVRRLTETVEHVTATKDLTASIDVRGPDEIARLARSFAAMMAAVEESVQAQHRLVADASHELRTPLTSITTNLELLGDGAGVADPQAPALVEEARTQAEELRDLVNNLVDLARFGRQRTHTEDTRLDLLAERVVSRTARRSPRVSLHTELTECLVHADPDALERAVGNLVDNAVKWSPDGGRVVVRVSSEGTLTVTDEGPGIPADDLPFVFDRFYRSPAARSLPGSGLGLAIVKQVADTHGGTVTAEPLAPGLRMRLSLPAAP
ncbi:ATP-binding protein [Streptomyces sp. NPDC002574]|uniref:sensor histidine kinase n=1 Tax=Streptomyces sp. NPDC002574 TaxID=3364652 RepID=UPI0036CF2210